ncbi:hypothetical protein NDU88_002392 [Pleurodeles waltl]|uniref:Uncharacterized protein n=1 Tax=Pleurodeles waltl TaxID=8319 RepID=A0AAV7VB53_PLEWA|nr:hypothetical protein NDU88_002392 [Pleurodeles waltl]
MLPYDYRKNRKGGAERSSRNPVLTCLPLGIAGTPTPHRAPVDTGEVFTGGLNVVWGTLQIASSSGSNPPIAPDHQNKERTLLQVRRPSLNRRKRLCPCIQEALK